MAKAKELEMRVTVKEGRDGKLFDVLSALDRADRATEIRFMARMFAMIQDGQLSPTLVQAAAVGHPSPPPSAPHTESAADEPSEDEDEADLISPVAGSFGASLRGLD